MGTIIMGQREHSSKIEQADGYTSQVNKWVRKRKNRAERRRAKKNPECMPGYGFYRGYVS
jgi:hypothetical protein